MAAQDLVTWAETREALGSLPAGDQAKVEALITRASEILELWAGRKLAERTFTDLRLTGPKSPRWDPPIVPIKTSGTGATITIKVDDVLQTVWKAEADGVPDTFDVIVASDGGDERMGLRNHFYRWAGWESALSWGWPESRLGRIRNPYNVLITYTGGFNPVPQDLKEACLKLVRKLWRDGEKGLAEITSINSPAGGGVVIQRDETVREVMSLLAPYIRYAGKFAGV